MTIKEMVDKLKPYFFWKQGNNAIEGHTTPGECGVYDLGTPEASEDDPRAFRNVYGVNYWQIDCNAGTVTPFSGGGGGRPYASIVIAAVDSSAVGASSADYVCSGTGDQAVINGAVASLSVGGKVVFLEGTYNLSGSITPIANTTLEGQGEGTRFIGSGSSAMITSAANGVRVQNLYIAPGNQGAIDLSGNDIAVRNVHILGNGSGGSTGVVLSGERCYVQRSRIENCGTGVNSSGESTVVSENIVKCLNGAKINSGVISGNIFEKYPGSSYSSGVILESGQKDIAITANMFHGLVDGIARYDLSSSYTRSVTIHGNSFTDISERPLVLYRLEDAAITGNTFYNVCIEDYYSAIEIDSYCRRIVVANNSISKVHGGAGIFLSGGASGAQVQRCIVDGNSISDFALSDEGYPYYYGIDVSWTENSLIQNNVVADSSGLTQGGIGLGNGTVDNIVVSNSVIGVTGSTKISIGGSGNLTSYPSGASGDNFD